MKEWGSGGGKYLDFSLLLSSSLCWCLPLTKLNRKPVLRKAGWWRLQHPCTGHKTGKARVSSRARGQMETVYHTDTQYEPRNVSGCDSAKRHLRSYHDKNPEVQKRKQTCHMNGAEVLRREVRDEAEVRYGGLRTTMPRRLGHILCNMTEGICCGVENTSS